MCEGSPDGEDAAEHQGIDVIALVDYGAGNLTSVRKALAHLEAEFVTPTTASDLERAHGIIVPGVGHFEATRAIDEQWRHAIRSAVDRGAALFGICLGMQWLFEGSAEAPGLPGLAVFDGCCQKLPDKSTQQVVTHPTPFQKPFQKLPDESTQQSEMHPTPLLKIPHVGWNSLVLPQPSRLMNGVEQNAQVYFTHSFVAPPTPAAAATTTYGQPFTSAVERGRVSGVQFHPEKSGDVGLRILRNWLHAL
jgi:imidazole glycerol-phosphate synthase subunit HisH